MQTQGNTVLITGGSAGIGLALAKVFLANQNKVIITGRNPERLAHAQAQLPGVITEVADVTSSDDQARLAQKYSDINVLVNNAGVQHLYELADPGTGLDLIQQEINTNLTAPISLIKLFLPYLVSQPTAAIVNLSSGLGYVPKQSAPVYCGTKAGIHIFSKALRWQLENSPVKVFEVVPPVVDTEMTAGRGVKKISPDALAAEFWHYWQRNTYEMHINRAKSLRTINRLSPRTAERIMRGS